MLLHLFHQLLRQVALHAVLLQIEHELPRSLYLGILQTCAILRVTPNIAACSCAIGFPHMVRKFRSRWRSRACLKHEVVKESAEDVRIDDDLDVLRNDGEQHLACTVRHRHLVGHAS